MRRILAMTLLLMAAAGAVADDVTVHASVDGPVVRGESFTLTVLVEGPLRGIEAPQLPELPDFFLMNTSTSSNFSFINGKTSNTKVWHYNMIADKEGEQEIPAIPVVVKGKTYRTEPIAINVLPGGGSAPPVPSVAPGRVEDEGRQVFIRSWTDRETVYVGEQLVHHFALYRSPRVRFRGSPQYEAPETEGFWSEPLGDEISGFQKVRGQDFAVTELRTALFAHEPGRQTIGPATLRVVVGDPFRDDFFAFGRGKEKILRSESVELEVLPLPQEGRPAGFEGTVARNLSLEASLEDGPYEVGQPVTLSAVLTGEGNPRTFASPALDPGEGWRSYDSDHQSEVSADEERILVRKTFTWVLVPQREGALTLPGLEYPWFDPEKGAYRIARTRPFELAVAPSSNEGAAPVVFSDLQPGRLEAMETSIHHIKTDPPLAGDGQRFPRSAGFWTALALPWPLLAGAWFWRRRRDAIASDRLGHRARTAGKAARRHLKDASEAMKRDDHEAFCAALARGLRGYLADRLGVSAAGLSDEAAADALARAGIADELCERMSKLLASCDQARFAPGSSDAARRGELLAEAEGLIGAMEKGGRKGRAGLLATLLLMPLVALATPEQDMAAAAMLYEQGDFAGATARWEALAETGLEDSHLWYNLGNAYQQMGETGLAVLNYRRALRLAPRDREAHENLEIVRALRAEPLQGEAPGGLARVWTWTRHHLSPGEMAVLSLVALWFMTVLLLLGILRRASWRRLRTPLLISLLLIVFLGAGAWRAEWEDWSGREGVLMAPAVKVLSGPGEDFIPLFELHEGAELSLQERRGDWLRVQVDEELEGWVPSQQVQTL